MSAPVKIKGSEGTCARCRGEQTRCESVVIDGSRGRVVLWLCPGCVARMRALWNRFLAGEV
jgi:hypothetical protein